MLWAGAPSAQPQRAASNGNRPETEPASQRPLPEQEGDKPADDAKADDAERDVVTLGADLVHEAAWDEA
jgi:hypothetical protein